MVLIWLTLRYHFTGRFWDILRDLAEMGSFPESHADPVANNKRTYGSDEPVESPPGSTSKASPDNRGPIAGSKRVSSSLSSARWDAASAVNHTNTSSPTSTTIPGTQVIRGDPSIFSMTGTVSTPENTDGLESSRHSSPGTLTTIFDGDAIPITTNDLGRLPLHYGVKFPRNSNLGEMANGWNTSGSGQASTILGVQPAPGLSQGGVNSRATQTGAIPGLHPPQEQHPEDLFPWMSYTAMVGTEEVMTDPVLTLATVETETKPNLASTYVTADSDSTISSFFGDAPSTSFTTLGQMGGLLPGPTSNATEDHMDLFNTMFPLSDPPAGTHPSTTAQTTQQPHGGDREQGYRDFPLINEQAYLHGWSNAPQAFE